MLNKLVLTVTKFQLPSPKCLGTVVKNILGVMIAPPHQIGLKSITVHIITSVVINEDMFQMHVYNNCVYLIHHNTILIAYMYYNYWVLQNLYMVMHILKSVFINEDTLQYTKLKVWLLMKTRSRRVFTTTVFI